MEHESKKQDEPILRSFSRDDAKLLIITFAGTVAANIITVILVGLAIVSARSSGFTTHRSWSSILLDVAVLIAGIVMPIIVFIKRRTIMDSDPKVAVWLIGITLMLMIFALYLVFELIGMAARIK